MPDDDRKRRRLGDATKGRIADLADGWTLDQGSKPVPESDEPPSPRRKQKTIPPPPPGSVARRELEEAIVDAKDSAPNLPRVTEGVDTSGATKPPPIPVRTKSPTPDSSALAAKGTGASPAGTPRSLASGTSSSPTSGPVAAKGSTPVATEPSGRKFKRASSPAPNEIAASLGTGRGSGAIAATPAAKPHGGQSTSGGADAASASGVIEVSAKAAKPRVGAKSGSVPAIPPRPAAPPLPVAPDPKPIEPAPAHSASAPIPRLPAVIVEDQGLATAPDAGADLGARGRGSPAPAAKLLVPIGEFDDGAATIDEDKLRVAMSQATIKRDAASALLNIPEPASTKVKQPPVELLLAETATALRGDPTGVESGSTSRFERGDPTTTDSERRDATVVSDSSASYAVGTLRNAARLRRKRGLGGDVRYVATAILGVRRARRELDGLEKRQATQQQSHRRHLVTIGRTAVTTDLLHHPAIGRTREQLAAVEDERSQHAGQVAAADAELQRVKRDRDAKAKQHVVDLAAIDAELVELAKKVDPLEKEAVAARKHADELRESLARIERRIADTEAKLVSVRGQKLERSEILSEIASLKADRLSVKRDEPKIAGELDALNPRLAAVEAARAEAHRRRDELAKAEVEDKRRIEELLTAIGAKRKVVERAAGDAEAARDKILFELGERLYVDRPDALVAQLSPIDEIDLELGEADRRIMELREILSSVDKSKLARGILVLVLTATTLGAFIAWVIVNLIYG